MVEKRDLCWILSYYPNAPKSLLIVKEQYLDEAESLFAGSEIKLTTEGQKHLGDVIGNPEYKKKYIQEKNKGMGKLDSCSSKRLHV